MESFLDALLLGVIQGLTEFLPVSSSGHLALAERLMGWENQAENLAFAIAVHTGSLAALLVFVRAEIRAMFTTQPRLIAVVAVASLPLAFALWPPVRGLVERLSARSTAVGAFLICTGLLLLIVRRATGGTGKETRLPYGKALGIGLAQVVALLPGISRSGTTIVAGIQLGMDREQAVRFSFLLGVPAIAGAFVVMLAEGGFTRDVEIVPTLVAVAVSFAASLFAMKWMVGVVVKRRLGWFAAYCVLAGATAVVLS